MKFLINALTTLGFATLATASANAATITQATSAADLVNTLLGVNSGITVIGTPTLSGLPVQFGTFTDGNIGTGLGVDSGIALSSGNIGNAIGRYSFGDSGTNVGRLGDLALTALLPPPAFVGQVVQTRDAASLSFDFTTSTGSLYFLSYVFASQEYPGFVTTTYNDVFAFFIDGVNIAKVPGTNLPVSVNTINNGGNDNGFRPSNPNLYIPNRNNARTLLYGGLTVPLQAQILNLSPGVHSFKLAIADGQDGNLDSAVFLASNGVAATPFYPTGIDPSPNPAPTDVPEPFTIFGTLVGIAGVAGIKRRLTAKNVTGAKV